MKTICAALLAVSSITAMASDQLGRYVVHGMGTESCGSFVQARRQPDNWSGYGTWLTGYLTSVNVYTEDTYDISGTTDLEGIKLWVENYCQKNPLENISTAAEAAVDALTANRHRVKPVGR
jgi:hypothetical protein